MPQQYYPIEEFKIGGVFDPYEILCSNPEETINAVKEDLVSFINSRDYGFFEQTTGTPFRVMSSIFLDDLNLVLRLHCDITFERTEKGFRIKYSRTGETSDSTYRTLSDLATNHGGKVEKIHKDVLSLEEHIMALKEAIEDLSLF